MSLHVCVFRFLTTGALSSLLHSTPEQRTQTCRKWSAQQKITKDKEVTRRALRGRGFSAIYREISICFFSSLLFVGGSNARPGERGSGIRCSASQATILAYVLVFPLLPLALPPAATERQTEQSDRGATGLDWTGQDRTGQARRHRSNTRRHSARARTPFCDLWCHSALGWMGWD
jgi:hypothetical protein